MDAWEVVITAVIVIILIIIVVVVVKLDQSSKQAQFRFEIAKIDSSFTTRTILDYELTPGYKVFEAIIDGTNNNNQALIDSAITRAIDAHYGADSQEEWVYIINGLQYNYKLSRKISHDIINFIPRLSIPNPSGQPISIIIKRVVPTDYKVVNAIPFVSTKIP